MNDTAVKVFIVEDDIFYSKLIKNSKNEFLFLFFNPIETPANVPPVPTAQVKPSIVPAV